MCIHARGALLMYELHTLCVVITPTTTYRVEVRGKPPLPIG